MASSHLFVISFFSSISSSMFFLFFISPSFLIFIIYYFFLSSTKFFSSIPFLVVVYLLDLIFWSSFPHAPISLDLFCGDDHRISSCPRVHLYTSSTMYSLICSSTPSTSSSSIGHKLIAWRGGCISLLMPSAARMAPQHAPSISAHILMLCTSPPDLAPAAAAFSTLISARRRRAHLQPFHLSVCRRRAGGHHLAISRLVSISP